MKIPFPAFLATLLLCLGSSLPANAAEEKAVFGAGCFWCVEAFFEQQPGVTDVVSGYAGGTEKNPTYKQVGGGETSHAEVVQVTFDPDKTSYAKLVDFFWKTHDATDGRGVAPDFGRQYRSAIIAVDEKQKTVADEAKAAEEKRIGKKIATEITLGNPFYLAEDYHQDYVRKNPKDRYVQGVAIPKMKKLGLKLPGK